MAGKPRQNPRVSQQEEIAWLKEKFLSYYEALPIKTAACDFIDRSLDTISIWEANDPEFAGRIRQAKAEYARKHSRTRPDNILSRLYEEFKPPKQEVEQSGETAVTITYVYPTDNASADDQTGSNVAEAPGQLDN